MCTAQKFTKNNNVRTLRFADDRVITAVIKENPQK